MNNLTAGEIKALDKMTSGLNPEFALGTRLQNLIATLPKVGTPVNAVNASIDLTLTGVVKHGEMVTIGSDVYEFLADAAQSKSGTANIAVDITSHAAKSTGTLTVTTKPTAGDTMTIGEKVYTFVPVGTANADGEISIGADVVAAQANIVDAINGTDGFNDPNPVASASDFAANVSTITALVGGTAGDTIATTETFTAVPNVFGAATLGSGSDCSAANAIVHLIDAVTTSGTEGVTATDEAGDVVKFTADEAGVSGNAIAVATTLANGTFAGAATHLVGGVDGTVGLVQQYMVDTSYLYVCVADNHINDKNWRRISVGAAF